MHFFHRLIIMLIIMLQFYLSDHNFTWTDAEESYILIRTNVRSPWISYYVPAVIQIGRCPWPGLVGPVTIAILAVEVKVQPRDDS